MKISARFALTNDTQYIAHTGEVWSVFRELYMTTTLLWRHNEWDSVSNHQPHDCLLNCLFGRRSKKTSKLRVTGLCAGNSPETGEFPAQRASNAENVSIWWRHHEIARAHCVAIWQTHFNNIMQLDQIMFWPMKKACHPSGHYRWWKQEFSDL